ncbi:MAG: terpene cyclase/mutase family protein [Planctomycetales bacterium]
MNPVTALLDRRSLLAGGAALSMGWSPCVSLGQRRKPTSEMITPKTQQAINGGLAFLARAQQADGSFGGRGFTNGVAVCALGGLAFMSSGDPPGQGKYGKNIERCVDFLIARTQTSGFIGTVDGRDRMYGHGFASLFLAQAYGMVTHRDDVGPSLRKSIELIVKAQNGQGGWRYQPTPRDADLSVTICQMMALRAAADAGISVPKATRARAINYVRASQTADGGFMYTHPRGHATMALTAAGLVSLQSAGIHDGPEIDKGLNRLMRYVPTGNHSGSQYYYYGHYYAAQATWHAGGTFYHRWYPAIRDELLSLRVAENGSWPSTQHGGEYATAMACIILQIPNNMLPIFAE